MRQRLHVFRSAVARRLFWVLVCAAVLPLAMFGGLGWQLLDGYLEKEDRQHAVEQLKQIGLRGFDRLSAARASLAAHAQSAAWASPNDLAPEVREMMVDVATVSVVPGQSHGDPELLADWERLRPARLASDPDRVLWWLPAADGGDAQLLLSHAGSSGRGWWIARLAPSYVWMDFAADGPGAGLCVTDEVGQVLHCPRATTMGQGTRWMLFLDGAFGSPAWRLAGQPANQIRYAELPLGEWLLQGALATVLLVALLGLVQVRRTMGPLDRLTATTRRLSAGDWSARAHLNRGDEFGKLGESLDGMADRIDRQMQALAVQSAIDRSILDGVDLDAVLQHVADRLQVLLPQAAIAVLARDLQGYRWQTFRPGLAQPKGVPAPDGLVLRGEEGCDTWATHEGSEPPAWLCQALDRTLPPPTACTVPVLWQGEPVALLLVATARCEDLTPDIRREVHELRGRVAVGLAAASREQTLREQAVMDSLTGLLNRAGLQARFASWIASTDAPVEGAVIFIDLDGFKAVNDAFGHHAGDELLCAVARRLSRLVPAAGLLARPGGDEFLVVLPGPDALAHDLATAICERLSDAFALRDQQVYVGASVGIATVEPDVRDLGELMRRADLAMYDAKAAGRGTWRVYRAELDEQAAERAWIARDLRDALLETSSLQLHYQPRIDARSGRVLSAEALLRWNHPTRGPIAPMRFIGVAEETGQIDALGRYVLFEALGQLARWRRQGLPVDRVAVNVSVRQLHDRHFAQRVLEAVKQHGLKPQDLEIEITESLFAGDLEPVMQRLSPLREAGVQVALDDFGTGFSSLSMLHALPIDVLKIDRSFVSELGLRPSAEAVVQTVVSLAHALGKHVVAEGVETAAQSERLADMGCDEFQGYHFSRPLPAEAFEQRVRVGFCAREAVALD